MWWVVLSIFLQKWEKIIPLVHVFSVRMAAAGNTTVFQKRFIYLYCLPAVLECVTYYLLGPLLLGQLFKGFYFDLLL